MDGSCKFPSTNGKAQAQSLQPESFFYFTLSRPLVHCRMIALHSGNDVNSFEEDVHSLPNYLYLRHTCMNFSLFRLHSCQSHQEDMHGDARDAQLVYTYESVWSVTVTTWVKGKLVWMLHISLIVASISAFLLLPVPNIRCKIGNHDRPPTTAARSVEHTLSALPVQNGRQRPTKCWWYCGFYETDVLYLVYLPRLLLVDPRALGCQASHKDCSFHPGVRLKTSKPTAKN